MIRIRTAGTMLAPTYKTLAGAQRRVTRDALTHWEIVDGDDAHGWRLLAESHPPAPRGSAPAQVIYFPSRIMHEHRTEVALNDLERADYTSEIMAELGMVMSTHEVLGARVPETPIGRTFGPTHRRRSRLRARVAANGTGLRITRDTSVPTPRTGLFTGLAMDNDGTGLITGLEEE